MTWRRHLAETVTLIVAAALCSLISNALAGRERKLAIPGDYPDARALPTPVSAAGASLSLPNPTQAVPSPAVPSPAVPSPAEASPAPAPPAKSPGQPERDRASRPKGTPKVQPPPRPLGVAELLQRYPPHKDVPFAEVSGESVFWLREHGALVVDARRTKVYEEGHISGARNISVWESDADERLTALISEGRNQDMPIVVYCSGGDCEDSHMLSQKLWGTGFNNVLVYKDGWPDWEKRNGPGRTGKEP